MTDTRFTWLHKLVQRLAKSGITLTPAPTEPAPCRAFAVPLDQWGRLPSYLAEQGCRLVALWAEQRPDWFRVSVCLEKQGDYLLLKVAVPTANAALPSWSAVYPGANRLERHARDLFGVHFEHSPDARRWTRHQAWTEQEFPLQQAFPVRGTRDAPTPADAQYPFLTVEGDAVYEIPVGPVHAGIIEPGHFRFHAIGETVLNLETRLGYVHKGIEKIAEGRDAEGLLRLAARVSGDSAVAHAWAAAQALEHAAGIDPPARALHLRALLCERERIGNHLGDIAAICNDVAFSFAYLQFSRLRELWLRRNGELFGHRLLMDTLQIGGVRQPLDKPAIAQLLADTQQLRKELSELLPVLRDNQSLRDRLLQAGVLTQADARQLGCLGYVGRASGVAYDVRTEHRLPPYDQISLERPLQSEGDVAARLRQRGEELYASLNAIRELLEKLPHGPVTTAWRTPADDAAGLGIVEGWRGETLAFVRFGPDGRVRRYFPRDPSWFNWLALERLIHGNIVPDFPVCNKSINGSYAGVDL